jgi:hypothetical protein
VVESLGVVSLYPGSGRDLVKIENTLDPSRTVHLAHWGRTLCGRSTGLAWVLVDDLPTCDRCLDPNQRNSPDAA